MTQIAYSKRERADAVDDPNAFGLSTEQGLRGVIRSVKRLVDRARGGAGATAVWLISEVVSGTTVKPTLSTDGYMLSGSAETFLSITLTTATVASVKVWVYVDGVWGVPGDGTLDIGTDFLDRTTTVAVERLYVQVVDNDGDVTIKMAPISPD